jgi:hypothetical protein
LKSSSITAAPRIFHRGRRILKTPKTNHTAPKPKIKQINYTTKLHISIHQNLYEFIKHQT